MNILGMENCFLEVITNRNILCALSLSRKVLETDLFRLSGSPYVATYLVVPSFGSAMLPMPMIFCDNH
jgi:hypothetical protein